MRIKKSKTPNINKTRAKKIKDIQYKFLIVVIVVGVIHYYLVESQYIGSDNRYDLFVFWIPVLIGLFLILKFNMLSIDWKDILPKIKKEKNLFYKIIYLPFLFLMHFMLAVMFFWIPSNIIWDGINKIESNKNLIETFTLRGDEFHHSSGKSGSNLIRFIFNGKNESIRVGYQDIKHYLDKNPDDFQVIIDVKKGIWNYYILESWDIKEQTNSKIP